MSMTTVHALQSNTSHTLTCLSNKPLKNTDKWIGMAQSLVGVLLHLHWLEACQHIKGMCRKGAQISWQPGPKPCFANLCLTAHSNSIEYLGALVEVRVCFPLNNWYS